MTRVLALLGACLLVAAAVVARGVLTDDEGDVGDDPSGDGDLVVACIPELEAACRALDRDVAELRVEDPAATIAAVADGEEIDAWVTLDPWPEIADVSEGRELFGSAVGVARSDLTVIVRTERIPDQCDEPVTWRWLVDDLGDDVAVPDVDSALGRLVLGHAVVDFFGSPPASNDFEDPDLRRRLAALDLTIDDPIDEIRVGLPVPAATGTVLADLGRLGARLRAFTGSPGASPASVAVVVAGPDADRVAGEPDFTDAVEELGWELDPDATTTGLPSAGVLFALSQEVS